MTGVLLRHPLFLRRLAPLFFLALTLPGCATIISGSSSNIAVMTEPPGASCTLEREGGVVAVANPTPGSVTVRRSTRDMMLRCAHPAYGQGSTAVTAGINPMVIGNILVGGVVGVVVDAATGAIGRYPEQVSLALQPDPRLAGMGQPGGDTALLRRVLDERIAATRFMCPRMGGSSGECAAQLRTLQQERDGLAAPSPYGVPPGGVPYLPPILPGSFGS